MTIDTSGYSKRGTDSDSISGPSRILQLVQAKDGSTIQNIVQQVFVGQYEQLSDSFIQPWSVFERVNLKHFVGREWLINRIDQFVAEHDRGYFILEADAGLGKTSFLATLVKERGYIHHFCELAPGLDGITASLKSLAAQIILAYELEPYADSGAIPIAAVRPDYLLTLIKDAVQNHSVEGKLVIVIDALDEAGVPAHQNVLGLPSVLPPNVYFIVSQRPVAVALRMETPHEVFRLRADDASNLADMHLYLECAAKRPNILQVLRNPRSVAQEPYSANDFVKTLLAKCQGVWIYLHYVVEEIESGKRLPLDLESLPNDVWQYYAQYWSRWREQNEGKWYEEYLPLLSTLGAIQETLTLPHICQLSGLSQKLIYTRLFREQWSPFLATEGSGNDLRYRLYHASLREFLLGQTEKIHLTEHELSLGDELRLAVKTAHNNIAEHYISHWGRPPPGLPGIYDVKLRDIDARYGLRHLLVHLESANRTEDIHRLLKLSFDTSRAVEADHRNMSSRRLERLWERLWGSSTKEIKTSKQYQRHLWYSIKDEAGETESFLADIYRALLITNKQIEQIGWRPELIGLQCFYALIISSFKNISANMPPGLLEGLIHHGLWSLPKALAYAYQISRPDQKAQALIEITMCCEGEIKRDILSSALALVEEIDSIDYKLKLFGKLVRAYRDAMEYPRLTEFAKKQNDYFCRAIACLELHDFVNEEERSHLLSVPYEAASLIEHNDRKANVYARLLLYPERNDRTKAVREVTEWANKVSMGLLPSDADLALKLDTLVRMVQIRKSEQKDLLWKIRNIAILLQDWTTSYSTQILDLKEGELGQFLSTSLGYIRRDLKSTLADVFHERLWELDIRYWVLFLLERPNSPESRSTDEQGIMYASLFPHLTAYIDEETYNIINSSRDPAWKARLALEILPSLSRSIEEETLDTIRKMQNPMGQMKSLCNIIPWLSNSQRSTWLSIANRLPDVWNEQRLKAEALAVCAKYLEEEEASKILLQSLESASAIHDECERIRVLAVFVQDVSSNTILELVSDALQIDDLLGKADALLEVFLSAPGEFKPQIWDKLISIIQLMNEEEILRSALTSQYGKLPEQYQRTIMTNFMNNFSSRTAYGEILLKLTPYSDRIGASKVLTNLLVDSKHDDISLDVKIRALIELSQYLPTLIQKDLYQSLFRQVMDVESEHQRFQLISLCIQLGPAHVKEALFELLKSIDNEVFRARLLVKFAERPPDVLYEQLLAYVADLHDESVRGQVLLLLRYYLPETLGQKLLNTTLKIRDEQIRCNYIKLWVAAFPTDVNVTELMTHSWSESSRTTLAIEFLSHLPDSQRPEIFRMILNTEDPTNRIRFIVDILEHLVAPQFQASFTLYSLNNEVNKNTEILASVWPHLSYETKQRVLNRSNFDLTCLVEFLMSIAPYLSSSSIIGFLHKIWSWDAPIPISTLVIVAPYIQNEEYYRFLQIVNPFLNRRKAFDRLWHLVTKVVDEGSSNIDDADFMSSFSFYVDFVSDLDPHLSTSRQGQSPPKQMADAIVDFVIQDLVDYSYQISDVKERTRCLSELVVHLPINQVTEVCNRILSDLNDMTEVTERNKVLARLAPLLNTTQQIQALNLIGGKSAADAGRHGLEYRISRQAVDPKKHNWEDNISDTLFRLHEMLTKPAGHTDSDLLTITTLLETLVITAFNEVSRIADEEERAADLILLAPHVFLPIEDEVLSIVFTIHDDEIRYQVLSAYSTYLPKAATSDIEIIRRKLDVHQIRKSVFNAIRAIDLAESNGTDRPKVGRHRRLIEEKQDDTPDLTIDLLVRLSTYTSQQELLDFLIAFWLQNYGLEQSRSEALIILAPLVARMGYSDLAVTIVRSIQNENWRVYALGEVCVSLKDFQHINDLVHIAKAIESKHWQALALVHVISTFVLKEGVAWALDLVEEIDKDYPLLIAKALYAIVDACSSPKTRSNLVAEFLRCVRRVKNSASRAKLLVCAVKYLDKKELEQVFFEVILAVQEVNDLRQRSSILQIAVQQMLESDLELVSLYHIWAEILSRSSEQNRKILLSDLRDFAPVLVAYLGKSTAEELSTAVRDVCGWWP